MVQNMPSMVLSTAAEVVKVTGTAGVVQRERVIIKRFLTSSGTTSGRGKLFRVKLVYAHFLQRLGRLCGILSEATIKSAANILPGRFFAAIGQARDSKHR